jgi:hypothetical protein
MLKNLDFDNYGLFAQVILSLPKMSITLYRYCNWGTEII